MKNRTVPPVFDAAAVGLSSFCLIHCLALPVLALALPIAGALAEHEWIHKALVLTAIPFSGYAVFIRGAHLRDRLFVLLVTLGLALLTASAFIEYFHALEKPMTTVGAIFVATGHLWRWRRHQ
ncbi:MAG: MerC domain-containing protein [Hyphococcus sp.]